MRIKKKINLKKNDNEYAVILSVDREYADLFKQRKVLVGYYRRWAQPALRKPRCGKCHRLDHFSKECDLEKVKSSDSLGPDICINCTEYNEKLEKSKIRNPSDQRTLRNVNHNSSSRQKCLSYLSAVGIAPASCSNA